MKVAGALNKWYTPEERDDDFCLLRMIHNLVGQGWRILDVGAGDGKNFRYDLKGKVTEVVGVDLDPIVETNEQLDRAIVADITCNIPVEDNSFDVAFARHVLEHIEHPKLFLREMYRILRPNGVFLFCTPNKWHYVTIASIFTPQWFHVWYNQKRGRRDNETFPTYYRMNTVGTLRRQFKQAGFIEQKLLLQECAPNYLLFSMLTFLPGVAYERLVNSSNLFSRLRGSILGCFVKPSTSIR